MTADKNIVASGISQAEHLVAFDLVARSRYGQIPLDRLLVYLIDTVDASALPYLATQFDVLGYKGLKLAKTEAEQRSVIKLSIEFKRFAGTLWAVRESLRSIGYPNAVITENAGTDPVYGWAQFRIDLDGGDKPISEAESAEIVKMLNIYKRESSHLLDISYTLHFDDAGSMSDDSYESPATDEVDEMFMGGSFRHDGTYERDGGRNYSSDADTLEIEIIPV